MALVLEMHGHVPRVVHDPREVAAVADGICPDVAILDIGLPHIDGYQPARHLRGRASTAKLLMIALTGSGHPEDAERARAAGFDHHLVKPVDPETVHAVIGVPASGNPEP